MVHSDKCSINAFGDNYGEEECLPDEENDSVGYRLKPEKLSVAVSSAKIGET